MRFQIGPRSAMRQRPIYYRGPRIVQQSAIEPADEEPVADRLSVEELAAHESGHSCAQIALGKRLHCVKIVPESGYGETHVVPPSAQSYINSEAQSYKAVCALWRTGKDRPPKSSIADEVVCLAAGPAAQVRLYPKSTSSGWLHDTQRIDLLAGIFGDAAEEFKRQQLDRASDLVNRHLRAISRVARALADAEQHELTGDQVRALFRLMR
jgi:hypothetical protein